MSDFKVEIIPNTRTDDTREGLRILGRIVARAFLAEHNMALADEALESKEED